MNLFVPSQNSRRAPILWVGVAIAAVLALCAWPQAAAGESASDEPIVVLAASSLADVLPPVAEQWEQETGFQVEFSFAGSSRLARQILDGAPADVYVSANSRWMQHLAERDALAPDTRRAIAGNELVWIVPDDADAPPRSAAQVDPALIEHLALAGESVPAGIYADAALAATGLADPLSSRIVRADNVRAALEWVARSDADAGVVYRTDARAEPRVNIAFGFDPATHPPITYEAAALADTDEPQAAAGFVAYLTSSTAQRHLNEVGFAAAAPQPVEPTAAPGEAPEVRVDVWSAIRRSLLVGLWCALLGLVPAVGLGWLLARRDFFGKSALSTLVLAPLALPPVVTGFLLLRLFSAEGAVGAALASIGVEIPFSMTGAVIAAFTVGMPMYVLSARNAFESVDERFEEVSLTLGHSPWQTFRRVTLPLAAPGLAAGAVLMFARAIGEFGATAVLAGNLESETRTIPLAVYTLLESPAGGDAIQALVFASIALSFAAMLGYERLARWQRKRAEVVDHG